MNAFMCPGPDLGIWEPSGNKAAKLLVLIELICYQVEGADGSQFSQVRELNRVVEDGMALDKEKIEQSGKELRVGSGAGCNMK